MNRAERLFLEARDAPRQQGARAFELRGAMSLAELWTSRGAQLAPIYHWFTEGLDLPDLVRARAMLDSLA